MYCDKCGTKRIADETYCHNCGNVFGARIERQKKEGKMLKWILGIIIAIVVIYASLVIGKMIGNNESESEEINQLKIENTEIKETLAEQKEEYEATISKILESIESGKDDLILELEGISEQLKEEIIQIINRFKKESKEEEE